MDRSQILARKAGELLSDLNVWAEQNAILGPGEQLAFTLAIQSHPLVVQVVADNPPLDEELLNLKVEEFFTKSRLTQHEVSKGVGTRAFGCVHHYLEYKGRSQCPISSLREFLLHTSAREFLREPNAGGATVKTLRNALHAVGLVLKDE